MMLSEMLADIYLKICALERAAIHHIAIWRSHKEIRDGAPGRAGRSVSPCS